jgi:hypothetical protein
MHHGIGIAFDEYWHRHIKGDRVAQKIEAESLEGTYGAGG